MTKHCKIVGQRVYRRPKDAIEACDPERQSPITMADRIDEWMNWKTPMRVAFIIEAVTQYAGHVVNKREELESFVHSIISPHSWIECADDWQKEFADFAPKCDVIEKAKD